MTSDERSKILQMIENGKVSAEDGLRLMKILDEAPMQDELNQAGHSSPPVPEVLERSVPEQDPEISKAMDKARSLWMIPFWIGVVITTLGSWIMYSNMLPAAGFNGLFYCLGLPILMIGILVIMLGWSSKTSRWLFVSIKQSPGEHPQKIRFGFPLPLGLASWIFRNFGKHIEELHNMPVEQILDAFKDTSDPFVVNVDDGDDGEKVQVIIG